MRLSWKNLVACAGLVLALMTLTAAPQRAEATPLFAQQTGKDCSTCHQPGRELEGPAGLNPTGTTFLDTYKRCNYQITCALAALPALAPPQTFNGTSGPQPAAPYPSYLQPAPAYPQPAPAYPQAAPAYQPAPYYPQAAPSYHYGKAKFEDFCFGNSYFVVRVAGAANHLVRFKLDLGSKVHIELPDGSTFASQCGGFPSPNGATNPVGFD
jgi:hypothetical protein